MNLTQALEMHEDILNDIMESVATNLTAKLEELEEPTCPKVSEEVYLSDEATVEEIANFIRWDVHKLRVEAITEQPLKVIRRIQSKKYYESIPADQQMDRITPEDVARAKDAPIEELYDGVLKGSGGKQWGICPFHEESTESFFIDSDNRWRCFGACGVGGDSIDYIQKRDGVDFIRAVKVLINK